MKKKLLTNGKAFKRTDGRWGGTVWFMDEQGERKRKSFSGTSKAEVNKKMTAYIAEFNQRLNESDEVHQTLAMSMNNWLEKENVCCHLDIPVRGGVICVKRSDCMTEKITLCGDNCAVCPRYNANTDEKLSQVAELWHRIGWRETILSAAEMRCTGCSSHKKCTYNLVDCTISHEVKRCNSCPEFPCETINAMLERSRFYQRKCKEVCSPDEYVALECAFFHKEENLKKV